MNRVGVLLHLRLVPEAHLFCQCSDKLRPGLTPFEIFACRSGLLVKRIGEDMAFGKLHDSVADQVFLLPFEKDLAFESSRRKADYIHVDPPSASHHQKSIAEQIGKAGDAASSRAAPVEKYLAPRKNLICIQHPSPLRHFWSSRAGKVECVTVVDERFQTEHLARRKSIAKPERLKARHGEPFLECNTWQ